MMHCVYLHISTMRRWWVKMCMIWFPLFLSVAGSIRDMQASEERLDRGLPTGCIDARRHEDERARQQTVQVAAFDAAFLQTFSQMVQGFGHPVLWSSRSSPGLNLLIIYFCFVDHLWLRMPVFLLSNKMLLKQQLVSGHFQYPHLSSCNGSNFTFSIA